MEMELVVLVHNLLKKNILQKNKYEPSIIAVNHICRGKSVT